MINALHGILSACVFVFFLKGVPRVTPRCFFFVILGSSFVIFKLSPNLDFNAKKHACNNQIHAAARVSICGGSRKQWYVCTASWNLANSCRILYNQIFSMALIKI